MAKQYVRVLSEEDLKKVHNASLAILERTGMLIDHYEARKRLQEGCEGLLNEAGPDFETVMIETALEHTAGRRQDAARLLGWGRNTLTRKIKELDLDVDG